MTAFTCAPTLRRKREARPGCTTLVRIQTHVYISSKENILNKFLEQVFIKMKETFPAVTAVLHM